MLFETWGFFYLLFIFFLQLKYLMVPYKSNTAPKNSPLFSGGMILLNHERAMDWLETMTSPAIIKAVVANKSVRSE